jgi:hypothetical protein
LFFFELKQYLIERQNREVKILMANPNPTVRQNGGKREGAGRPKGSKNINSMASVKKLEELKFDPIEQMVSKYEMIEKALNDGSVRVGSGAYTQLLATQGQLINNLMQYGYKKVPEKIEQEITEKRPVAIKLNLKPKEKVA